MNKREHILQVAETLFAEHGYEGTSVRLLAKNSAVNIAMISYYFGSKEKLFEALVEYRASSLKDKLKSVGKETDNPVKIIEQVVDLIVDRIFSNPDFHRLLHREISLEQRSKMASNIVDVLMQNFIEVKKIIRKGIKKRIFRDVDIEMLLCSIFSTASQVAQSSLLTKKMLELDDKKNSSGKKEVRNRTKNYLKDLLKNYLLVKVK